MKQFTSSNKLRINLFKCQTIKHNLHQDLTAISNQSVFGSRTILFQDENKHKKYFKITLMSTLMK